MVSELLLEAALRAAKKKAKYVIFLVFASGKSRVQFNELCHPEEVLLVRGPKIVYICTQNI